MDSNHQPPSVFHLGALPITAMPLCRGGWIRTDQPPDMFQPGALPVVATPLCIYFMNSVAVSSIQTF